MMRALQTFKCEAESIINSKQLTKVSDDPNDLEPLTSPSVTTPE